MAKERSVTVGRFRLVFQRGSIPLKCVALVMLILCTITLMTLRGAILQTREGTTELRSQAAILEQENRRLEGYLRDLGSVESVIRIAQEELGLAQPGTTLLEPEGSAETAASGPVR